MRHSSFSRQSQLVDVGFSYGFTYVLAYFRGYFVVYKAGHFVIRLAYVAFATDVNDFAAHFARV